MYFKEGETQELEISTSFKTLLAVVAAIIILLGVYPSLLLDALIFF
jgi:NADH-quinone oxidoreductase subunit N